MTPPQIQPVTAPQTHALRHRVLRPHQPLSDMAYPGDDASATIHLGAIDDAGVVVGIVSLYVEPLPTNAGLAPEPGDWRLRGMAVQPERQGQGMGTRLVGAGLDAVREIGAARVWCNARTSATGFYQRQGFTSAGDPFDLPGIGEHYVMWIAV